MESARITEEELHAYLDGELPQSRQRAVEAYLREYPQGADRLDAYRRDGEAIAHLFSRVTPHLDAAPATTPTAGHKTQERDIPWRSLAAGFVIFIVGSAAGWLGHDYTGDDSLRRLGYQAETAYLLASGSASELRSSNSLGELSGRIASVLGMQLHLHEMPGTDLSLTGVRILKQPSGPAVQLTFAEPTGQLVALYFERRPGATETQFRRLEDQGLTTLVWEDDNLGCAITGTESPERLEEIARTIYKSLLS